MIRYIHLKDTYVILEVFKMRVDKEKKMTIETENQKSVKEEL